MGLFGFGKKKNNTEVNPPVSSPTYNTPPTSTPAYTNTPEGREVTLDLSKGGMLNLQKNDFLNLSKTDSTLQNIRVSAGWDVNTRWGSDYDLDLCAMLLGSDGRIIHTKDQLIYYGNKKGTGIELDHDNLTGEGDGDDENMFINFSRLSPEVEKIVVCVVIYSAQSRGQSFKHVRNAYVRLVDQAQRPEREICRYNLSEDGGNATAVKFAELLRTNSGWVFKAIGEYKNASIEQIRNEYR